MTDVRAHNRLAWDGQVRQGNVWTRPVSPETIARARQGDWTIVLTPRRPVPRSWFPPLAGARVLALASGGGQQGPVLAAAGAEVTVLDNSPAQLAQDRLVVEREGLQIRTVEGDMRDLSGFEEGSFDLIVHPCSNCFVPDVRPVWREAYRVLRAGGTLLSGFVNPIVLAIDSELEPAILEIRHRIPYSDLASLSKKELKRRLDTAEPLVFGHTLEDLMGGQLDAGFIITGFYEDGWDPAEHRLSGYLPCFGATRALKAPR